MIEPARVIVDLQHWTDTVEKYRFKLREAVSAVERAALTDIDFSKVMAREQVERIFLRCIGALDGTYHGHV